MGEQRPEDPSELCARLGVPLRVYGGYLEARAALRANAPAAAARVLEWLVCHLAQERGARGELSVEESIVRLRESGAIAPALPSTLTAQALAKADRTEQAWALLSVVEHVFQRLYIR